MLKILCLIACFISSLSGHARTYYVDYLAGKDSNSGKSPTSSWKHCPGDTKAQGLSSKAVLQPGDTVVFKGGVDYPGELTLKFSGRAGKPIVLDGNSAGKFGKGKAIFSGATTLFGWRPCKASDLQGIPLWDSCFVVNLSTAVDPFSINLFYQDKKRGAVAREPNIPDPLWWDKVDSLIPISKKKLSKDRLMLPKELRVADANSWTGAVAGIWTVNNLIATTPITAISKDGKIIKFDPVNSRQTDDNRFAIFNHLKWLDREGEYVITNGGKRLIFHHGESKKIPKVSISTRKFGIHLNNQSFYHIKNIVFRNYAGAPKDSRAGSGIISWKTGRAPSEGIHVSDSDFLFNQSPNHSAAVHLLEVNNATIERCRIEENQGNSGIYLGQSSNSVVRGNTLIRNGYTGIRVFAAKNIVVEDNRVLEHGGVHANGMSVYLQSENVRLSRNFVSRGNIPLTIQSSTGVTVDYNVLASQLPNQPALAIWTQETGKGPSKNISIRNNVIVAAGNNALVDADKAATGVKIVNNIISGSLVSPEQAELSHNLYLKTSWMQQKPGWKWEEGVVIPGANQQVFRDPASEDFRLAGDSPAIDAGVNWGQKKDFAGNTMHGSQFDIGAFESGPPKGAP